MSLRAELIRLCLPWFMRPRFPPDAQIEDVRRRMARFAHLIPHPPRGTEVIPVDAGGVRAEWITTAGTMQAIYAGYFYSLSRRPRPDGVFYWRWEIRDELNWLVETGNVFGPPGAAIEEARTAIEDHRRARGRHRAA